MDKINGSIEKSGKLTPLEAERPVACRGDDCSLDLANTGFNAPCELLTGLTTRGLKWSRRYL